MANTITKTNGLSINSALDLAPPKLRSQSKAESSAATTQAATKDLSKDMFLKLMVAQLKYQNPLNPVDGTDFLQQLSQISGVEQMVEMRKELASIHQLLGRSASGKGEA